MVPRDRAFTRGTIRKAKRKAKRVLKLWQWFEDEAITPKQIGRSASVHCRFCSCVMCGNRIPDGQCTCSMCYGDPGHGSDGYYEQWLEEQAAQDQIEQEAYEQA